MRTLEDAQNHWPHFEKLPSLPHLRAALIDDEGPSSIVAGLRSLCWKTFLLFDTVQSSTWAGKLQGSRDGYESLRAHFLRNIEHPDELASTVDPLSDSFDSPWEALRKDEASRREIFQDVERCMPDNYYFQQPETQAILLDILFIWSKLNPDVGYRQGMHEVLAPILWTVERDAIDPESLSGTGSKPAISRVLEDIFDARFIAHDTFTLFGRIMQSVKSSYEAGTSDQTKAVGLPARSVVDVEAPIVLRSRRIINYHLDLVDPPLASHLKDIDIVPQVFLMRWIRLLFGREFPFDHVLLMWDRLFAHDSSLQCIDLICVAMLLRIRWQLIDADYNEALSLLLRYPALSEKHSPSSLVDDALYLKTHLDFDGGYALIAKRTGKDPPMSNRPQSPDPKAHISNEEPQPRHKRNVSSVSKLFNRNTATLEHLIEETAKGIYQRGEKWGVTKAVRDAVGEVQKNIQSLQPNRHHSRTNSAILSDPEESTQMLLRKIDTLQARNAALGRTLESAVDELWRQQKETISEKAKDDAQVAAFTLAIARVQFVQVYLEDSSLPLPIEDDGLQSNAETPFDSVQSNPKSNTPETDVTDPPSTAPIKAPPSTLQPSQTTLIPKSNASNHSSSDPTSISSTLPTQKSSRASNTTAQQENPSSLSADAPATLDQNPPPTLTSRPPKPKPNPAPTRPSLEQSSFSWMLGQDPTRRDSTHASSRSAFISASPFTMAGEKRGSTSGSVNITGSGGVFGTSGGTFGRANAGYLFGDDDEEDDDEETNEDNETDSADINRATAKDKDKTSLPQKQNQIRGSMSAGKGVMGKIKSKTKGADGDDIEDGQLFRLGTLKKG